MRRIARSLVPALLGLLLLAQAAFAASPALPDGFNAEAFRKNFAAGLGLRPNAPALDPAHVRVDLAEQATSLGGMAVFLVKGVIDPGQGQAQPFLLFVSADGQFYVPDIVSLSQGKSVLKDARDSARAAELKTLGHTVFKGKGGPVLTFVSDPFCPHCRNAYAYLMGKTEAFSEFRLAHYPLPGHPGADIACSLMAWAAVKAPAKHADFVRFAYTDLPMPSVADKSSESVRKAWVEVAEAFLKRFPELKALGKTGPAIVEALGGSAYAKSVQEDLAKSAGLEITGTPVIFLETLRVEGFDKPRLDQLLQ